MNVWHAGACYFTRMAMLSALITETLYLVVLENRFSEEAGVNSDDAMTAVVIMNGSSMTRSPAKYKHLNGIVATNAMPPIISIFETNIRLKIILLYFNVGQP
jgi:hypothetical protein